MMRFVRYMLFRSLDENRYIGFKNKSSDYYDFIFEDNLLKELEGFLHNAGIEENLTIKTDVDGKKRLFLIDKRLSLSLGSF